MTMMSSADAHLDLAEVLEAAHRGDQSAWEILFRECYPKFCRVVRRKLNPRLRSLFDSTDFASDVMKSLAAKFGHLDFPSINSLLAFLTQVAEQKVIDEHRRQNAQKRAKSRETLNLDGAGDTGPVQFPSDDPTASQWLAQKEFYELLLSRLEDETERTIITLRRQGYSNPEIAERTGWNIRKVQRFLKHLEDSMHDSGG